MKLLAIEASSLVCSAAILEDEIIVAEYTVNNKTTHSQLLLPMIDEICQKSGIDISEMDAIAVSAGPGSFTGLRIGSATAKGLAGALDIPIVHVPTLEAMAYNYFDSRDIICPIMDARRGQVYTGIYTFENGELRVLEDGCAISIEELLGKLEQIGRYTIFAGDGIPVHREYIENNFSVAHSFGVEGLNRQRAAGVAALGKKLFLEGKTVSAAKHLPEYFRLSQAERERLENNG